MKQIPLAVLSIDYRYLCLLVKSFVYHCLVYDGIGIVGLKHLLQILVSVKLVFELCTMFIIVTIYTLLVAGCLLFHASLQHWSRAGYWRWPDRTLRNPKAQSWPGLFSFQFVFEKKIISFQFRLVCCNQYAEELTIRKPTSFYLQALHLDALSDVDNSTQSLLMFTGNESVHGLYDILLNYK